MSSPVDTIANQPITPDYAALIRAEIAAEVKRLKDQFYYGQTPKRVVLGYLTSTHRGQPIFQAGELIEGLPVEIDRFNFHRITVRGTHDLDSVEYHSIW